MAWLIYICSPCHNICMCWFLMDWHQPQSSPYEASPDCGIIVAWQSSQGCRHPFHLCIFYGHVFPFLSAFSVLWASSFFSNFFWRPFLLSEGVTVGDNVAFHTTIKSSATFLKLFEPNCDHLKAEENLWRCLALISWHDWEIGSRQIWILLSIIRNTYPHGGCRLAYPSWLWAVGGIYPELVATQLQGTQTWFGMRRVNDTWLLVGPRCTAQ